VALRDQRAVAIEDHRTVGTAAVCALVHGATGVVMSA
jgi:hypothetical protein